MFNYDSLETKKVLKAKKAKLTDKRLKDGVYCHAAICKRVEELLICDTDLRLSVPVIKKVIAKYVKALIEGLGHGDTVRVQGLGDLSVQLVKTSKRWLRRKVVLREFPADMRPKFQLYYAGVRALREELLRHNVIMLDKEGKPKRVKK